MLRRDFLKLLGFVVAAPQALLTSRAESLTERELKQLIQEVWRNGEIPPFMLASVPSTDVTDVIYGIHPIETPWMQLKAKEIQVYPSEFGDHRILHDWQRDELSSPAAPLDRD
jgi:hypothetical protein